MNKIVSIMPLVHIPIRTCIGCGEKKLKKKLFRIVRSPNGSIMIDPSKKAAGRGAYVCPNLNCILTTQKKRGLDRSFRQHIKESTYNQLVKQTKLLLIVQKLEEHFGTPKWRGRGNPLNSLIKTILSQNTNDRNRDMAYEALRSNYPNWEKVMTADAIEIANVIRPAGLANQKSVRIKNILLWIQQTYGALDLNRLCEMDTDHVIENFLQLKGVGIKTISVVLMFACGKDIFPVDTHVHRLCGRLGLVPENASAEKTHHLMQPFVPKNKSYSLHMNLLKLGRTICKARKPNCAVCPLNTICPTSSI